MQQLTEFSEAPTLSTCFQTFLFTLWIMVVYWYQQCITWYNDIELYAIAAHRILTSYPHSYLHYSSYQQSPLYQHMSPLYLMSQLKIDLILIKSPSPGSHISKFANCQFALSIPIFGAESHHITWFKIINPQMDGFPPMAMIISVGHGWYPKFEP